MVISQITIVVLLIVKIGAGRIIRVSLFLVFVFRCPREQLQTSPAAAKGPPRTAYNGGNGA